MLHACIAMLCLTIVSCNQDRGKVAKLEEALKTLRETTDYQKVRLEVLEGQMEENKRPRFGIFSPDKKVFLPIHHDYGVFLVSLQNIQPYANGYKVELDLGNPMSISYRDVEFDVSWGPHRPDSLKDTGEAWETWRKRTRTKTEKLTTPLRPGMWNPVEVILTPAASDEIGEIQIQSIKTGSVALNAKQ